MKLRFSAFALCLFGFLALAIPTHSQSLAALSVSDRASILSACEPDRLYSGAAAYHTCLNNQLRDLAAVGKAPSLATIAYSDRASILSACEPDKLYSGAAAYHTCLNNQLSDLAAVSKAPSLATLAYRDRASILSACEPDRLYSGAAAYHTCLNNQLRDLNQIGSSTVPQRRITPKPTCTGSGCIPAATDARRIIPTVPVTSTSLMAPVTSLLASHASSTVIAPTTPTTGACAENGSCYGDISDKTGKPKTVAVPGYTRKDGTYVRGYYRSK